MEGLLLFFLRKESWLFHLLLLLDWRRDVCFLSRSLVCWLRRFHWGFHNRLDLFLFIVVEESGHLLLYVWLFLRFKRKSNLFIIILHCKDGVLSPLLFFFLFYFFEVLLLFIRVVEYASNETFARGSCLLGFLFEFTH